MKNSTILKIFLTILLLVILVIKVDFIEVIRITASLNLFSIVSALALVPVLYAIRAIRWNIFLRSVDVVIPLSQSYKVLLIGNFYGLVTPGKIGELGRAYHMNEKKVVTLPTIIMEKIADICTLICLSVLTVILFFQNNSYMLIGTILCAVVIIFGLFILTNKKIILYITSFLKTDQDNSRQFTENLQGLLRNYPVIGNAFLMTIVYYLVAYVLGYLIILAAGFDPIVLITLPIIVLMGNIPLTISGLGLRESIGSLSFVYLGDTAANGFVFSFLIFFMITVIPGIVGYLLTLKEY